MARPKTLVVDFRDLPDVDTDELVAGRSLEAFLACIVSVASLEGDGARVRSPIRCRCRPGRRRCPGRILIARRAGAPEVEWRCSECEFNGIISHWQGSIWDNGRAVAASVPDEGERTEGRSHPGLLGRWFFERMEAWGREAIGLLGPGYIEFARSGGSMQFIAVKGHLDCRHAVKGGMPVVEFSWAGLDEGDEVSGRGWAQLEGGGHLVGHIYIHNGDDSSFAARRAPPRIRG